MTCLTSGKTLAATALAIAMLSCAPVRAGTPTMAEVDAAVSSSPAPTSSSDPVHETPPSSTRLQPYQPRFGRSKPIVAIVGANESTELIDFVVPYGILQRAGVAEVHALAVAPGPITMRPAVVVEPGATIAQFDRVVPEGADYVIVPAGPASGTSRTLVRWLQSQAAKGATVVSICDGALAVARAGLFKGRRATGHWATRDQREHDFPETTWLANTRYVFDGKVGSSAGISAAIPTSIALVEALAGRERASAVASEVGVDRWDSEHQSEGFERGMKALLDLRSRGARAIKDSVELPLTDGVDELALAVTADAMGRTERARTFTSSEGRAPVRSRGGLLIIPDQPAKSDQSKGHYVMTLSKTQPLKALDLTLDEIDRRYGKTVGDLVSVQLEYAR